MVGCERYKPACDPRRGSEWVERRLKWAASGIYVGGAEAGVEERWNNLRACAKDVSSLIAWRHSKASRNNKFGDC